MSDVLQEMLANNAMFAPDKMSDHSILLTTYKYREVLDQYNEQWSDSKDDDIELSGQPKPPKYRMKEVKEEFMKSPERVAELNTLLDELLDVRSEQEAIDTWYDNFIKIYHAEIELFYKKLSDTPKSRKNFSHMRNEWWNEELSMLAKEVHTVEKLFVRMKKVYKNCILTSKTSKANLTGQSNAPKVNGSDVYMTLKRST